MNFGRLVHNLLFKKQFSTVDKTREFIRFSDAKTIGIIYNATLEKNIDLIHQFAKQLKQKGKSVQVLGFINLKKPENIINKYKGYDFILKEDVTWFFKPKKFSSSRFIKNKYDILLNLYIEECLPLQYMSAFSDAKFRVGHYQKNNLDCNDFHIDLKGESDIKALIQQIENYLNKE